MYVCCLPIVENVQISAQYTLMFVLLTHPIGLLPKAKSGRWYAGKSKLIIPIFKNEFRQNPKDHTTLGNKIEEGTRPSPLKNQQKLEWSVRSEIRHLCSLIIPIDPASKIRSIRRNKRNKAKQNREENKG